MIVRVYRNLHRSKWSVQAKGENGWRVAFHADTILLGDCRAVVSAAGRERARKEGRRNVHAKIEGTLVATDIDFNCEGLPSVEYNPFRMEGFSREIDGAVFFGDGIAFLADNKTLP